MLSVMFSTHYKIKGYMSLNFYRQVDSKQNLVLVY